MTSAVAEAPVKLPDSTGEQDECGPCDWYGYPAVRRNDPKLGDPTGPLSEAQRCPGCHELVCNRHPNKPVDAFNHFLGEHGSPIGDDLGPTDDEAVIVFGEAPE